jgi:multiple sugar transport system substrate-binding protein
VNDAPRVLPFIFSPVVLCYNKDHFREADLPEPDSSWTWSDLEEVSLKLSNGQDRYGFFYHLMSDNRWPIFLLQSGYVFRRNKNNRYEFGNEHVMRGLKISRDLIYKQGTFPFHSENDSDAERLFAQQKVSMIMATYFSLNALRDAKINFDISPLPTFRDPKTLLLIIGVAIHSHSPNKEAAAALVRFLLSYETQLFIRKNTLSIPAVKKAAEWQGEEVVAHPSRFHLYRETVPTFRLYTELNLTAEELLRIRQELKLYWSQIDDLATVCRRLEEIL